MLPEARKQNSRRFCFKKEWEEEEMFNGVSEIARMRHVYSYVVDWLEGSYRDLSNAEDELDDATSKLFEVLDKALPNSEGNEEIFDAVIEYSVTYSDIYLGTGIVLGLQLYKELEQTGEELTYDTIYDLLSRLSDGRK